MWNGSHHSGSFTKHYKIIKCLKNKKNPSSTTVSASKHNIYPTQGGFLFYRLYEKCDFRDDIKKIIKNIKYESHAICDVTMTKVENI